MRAKVISLFGGLKLESNTEFKPKSNTEFKPKSDTETVCLPKLATFKPGSVSVQDAGCYGPSKVKVTLPHFTSRDPRLAPDAKEDKYTYTWKY